MKSLNTYIFEVNNDVELFNMVNEVLNNEEYTSKQIEESFNYTNLILEKLNLDEIKQHKKKFADWVEKHANELQDKADKIKENLESQKKKISEFTKQLSNVEVGDKEYKDILSKLSKENKNFEKINSEYENALNDMMSDDSYYPNDDDDAKLGYFFEVFLRLNESIKWCIDENNKVKKRAESKPNDAVLVFIKCGNPYDDEFENLNKKLKEEKKKDKDIYETIILYLHDCVEALNMKDLYDINENDAIKVKTEDIDKFILKSTYGITADKIDSIYFHHKNKTFESVESFDKGWEMLAKASEGSKKDEENKSESSQETQSEEEQKEQTTEVISDNKDLLTPVAKAANVTGEQLLNIINKLCVDKKGKARKLEDGVILGLSLMICGMLLSVKKNGKSDNSAIKSIVDKMRSIMDNKKAIKSIIK